MDVSSDIVKTGNENGRPAKIWSSNYTDRLGKKTPAKTSAKLAEATLKLATFSRFLFAVRFEINPFPHTSNLWLLCINNGEKKEYEYSCKTLYFAADIWLHEFPPPNKTVKSSINKMDDNI